MPEEGSLVDVAPLHEPAEKARRERRKGFEGGVGLSGYERGTGDEVVREPVLKRSQRKGTEAEDLFSH
jgi:hypothetical protein